MYKGEGAGDSNAGANHARGGKRGGGGGKKKGRLGPRPRGRRVNPRHFQTAGLMADPRAVEALKTALRRLPGVGPKSAKRRAFHLLERDRDGAAQSQEAIRLALSGVAHCSVCNNCSETEKCPICASAKRDAARLCVVETPADSAARLRARG